MPGGLGHGRSHLPALTLPPARVGSGPLTHMGGFFGSPWNFIFLDEFAAAGGARISLSSLCEDTHKGHARSTPPPGSISTSCPTPSVPQKWRQSWGATS